jgi:hypothetical protein
VRFGGGPQLGHIGLVPSVFICRPSAYMDRILKYKNDFILKNKHYLILETKKSSYSEK